MAASRKRPRSSHSNSTSSSSTTSSSPECASTKLGPPQKRRLTRRASPIVGQSQGDDDVESSASSSSSGTGSTSASSSSSSRSSGDTVSRISDSLESHAITSLSAMPPNMRKYWHKRHALFSQYDSGILLDKQSWYSVTPEPIAARTAHRVGYAQSGSSAGAQSKPLVILDLFCGAGGNAIQFALLPPHRCAKVIAVDVDPLKIALARHNAGVYGIDGDRIEFVVADALHYLKEHKSVSEISTKAAKGANKSGQAKSSHQPIDVIFLSPPWGGVDYSATETSFFPLSSLLPLPLDSLVSLINTSIPEAKGNIIAFLPRHCDLTEITSAFDWRRRSNNKTEPQDGRGDAGAVDVDVDVDADVADVDVEECWLGQSLKALCVYSGPTLLGTKTSPAWDEEMARRAWSADQEQMAQSEQVEQVEQANEVDDSHQEEQLQQENQADQEENVVEQVKGAAVDGGKAEGKKVKRTRRGKRGGLRSRKQTL